MVAAWATDDRSWAGGLVGPEGSVSAACEEAVQVWCRVRKSATPKMTAGLRVTRRLRGCHGIIRGADQTAAAGHAGGETDADVSSDQVLVLSYLGRKPRGDEQRAAEVPADAVEGRRRAAGRNRAAWFGLRGSLRQDVRREADRHRERDAPAGEQREHVGRIG